LDTGISLAEVIRVVQSTQPPLFQSLAVPLARSLLALAEIDLSLVLDDPRILFQVFKKAILIPEAQGPEFALCQLLVEKGGGFLTPKVYPFLINLLGDFATLGSVGAEWEQRNDVLQKRMKPSSKTPDRPYIVLVCMD
jgi:hypothetical protein